MDSSSNQPKPSLPSGLSLIEKAQELRWTLQLATAVLFADLVLAWRTGKGVAHWSVQTDQLFANSGLLLVSVLGFGILMSIVMPLVAELFRQLGWQLLIAIPWPRWMQNERDDRRPAGGVLPSELRNHAYKKNDRALLDIVTAHQEREKKSIAKNLAAGQMAFSVLTLGVFDYFPRLLNIQAVTLLNEIPVIFGRTAELALVAALMLALAAIKVSWFSVEALKWIDYPPLYDELEKVRKSNQIT